EGAGERGELCDREIGASGLGFGDVAAADARAARQVGDRHAARFAGGAEAAAELSQQRLRLGRMGSMLLSHSATWAVYCSIATRPAPRIPWPRPLHRPDRSPSRPTPAATGTGSSRSRATSPRW